MTPRRTMSPRPERRFVIRGVRREEPDLRKLGKALLAVVLADQQPNVEQLADETPAGGGSTDE